MGELGDLLELLHGAQRSFRTLALEAREWRHTQRQGAAYERAMQRAGGQVVHVMSTSVSDSVPAEWEVRARAWFEQPNRVREEREEGGRLCVGVADGARWWTAMPEWATVSEEGDGWITGQIGQTLRPLLDPSSLGGAFELELLGTAERAGRSARLVAATPRHAPGSFEFGPLVQGADRHELAVDAERGVLLGATSFIGGDPAALVEVEWIAFDEPIDAAIFRYDPSPGEQVARLDEVTAGHVVTVEEAARKASFTVYVPRTLGHGWRCHVLYTPGHEGTAVRETVTLALYRDDATHSLTLRQTAGPFESWQRSGTEDAERAGRQLRVSTGPWHRVLVEQDGTFVELDSGTVQIEALVELALSLVVAPTEPPPLVG